MNDLRLNWENPFLFYDPDGDHLTEMAIRMVDSPKIHDLNAPSNSYVNRQLEGRGGLGFHGQSTWIMIILPYPDHDSAQELIF